MGIDNPAQRREWNEQAAGESSSEVWANPEGVVQGISLADRV